MLGDSAMVPALVAIGEEVEELFILASTGIRVFLLGCLCGVVVFRGLHTGDGSWSRTFLKLFRPLPQLRSLFVLLVCVG